MSQKLSAFESASNEAVNQFKLLSEKYSSIAASVGVQCKPYRDAAVPLFAGVGSDVQKRAIAFLENAIGVYEETIAQGESVLNNRGFIWRILSRLKFAPSSDIFEKMHDDDVIEIFSLDERAHVGWNLNLMDFVSHTIEQLLCVPWWELCERPADVTSGLFSVVEKIALGQINETVPNPVRPHIFKEINTEECLSTEIEIRYFEPLKQSGRNVGVMTITRVKNS